MRELDNAYWFKGIRHGIWFWRNEDINGKKAYSNELGKEWHLKVDTWILHAWLNRLKHFSSP